MEPRLHPALYVFDGRAHWLHGVVGHMLHCVSGSHSDIYVAMVFPLKREKIFDDKIISCIKIGSCLHLKWSGRSWVRSSSETHLKT